MQFELIFSDQVPRIAILFSKLPRCLQDLLLRHQAGEFKAEIALIISNHPDAASIADSFAIPFRHFPITAEKQASTGDRRDPDDQSCWCAIGGASALYASS